MTGTASGQLLGARMVLPDSDYLDRDCRVLRRADGTALFLLLPNAGSSVVSEPATRLRWTYCRNIVALNPQAPLYTQSGDEGDETAVLDLGR